ncbi:unnamed protein product [Camellia sinensis]
MLQRLTRFRDDFVLNTRIITMYSICGSPSDSRLVFDQLQRKNLYQWNAMVSGAKGFLVVAVMEKLMTRKMMTNGEGGEGVVLDGFEIFIVWCIQCKGLLGGGSDGEDDDEEDDDEWGRRRDLCNSRNDEGKEERSE